MPLLRQCLLDTYLVVLRAIADYWEIPLTTRRQREVALELTEAMSDPATIDRALARLPAEEGKALGALLASGGRMPRRVFEREWGEIRVMGPGRLERVQPWHDPTSPAEGLCHRGFVFRSFEQGPDGAYEAVSVPPELLEHLPAPGSAGPSIDLAPTEPPILVTSTEGRMVDDACTLLAYVQNQRPRLEPDDGWPERHVQRLASRLRTQDSGRFTLLRHLVTGIGWLVDDEARRLRPNPQTVTVWLQDSSFSQLTALTEAWRDDRSWNDLFHVPGLQPEDTGAWRNDPVLARQAILRHLSALSPSKWYELHGFISAIKEVDPDFQRPAGDYDSWYIRDGETGAYLSGFESWDAVEGRLIRYLITGPLTWLGLTDLGSEAPDRPPGSFRLNQDGAAFLGLGDPPAPSPPRNARLLSGFRVSVPAARRYERFQVARVADWVQSGNLFVYRLTPNSLTRAAEQGISIARVVEFLEEITEAPPPRPIEEALKRWGANGTEAWVERVVLLKLANEELMDEVTASPRLNRLIQERIGLRAAVVRQEDWPQVVDRLGQLGLLPELSDQTD